MLTSIPISFRATTVSLKQDVRVAAEPQPCVSPALCQDHADLPECAELDDELDCPGEPAESSGAFTVFVCPPRLPLMRRRTDEDGEGELAYPPPPSPPSSPSPAPSPSLLLAHSPLSLCCEPPRESRVARSPRARNRYSPMEVKAPSRKGKSLIHRMSSGSDDDEPKKPRKRREAVSLACYFCRKRKIACRQPPEGSPDRTCKSVFPSLDCPRQFHSFLVLGI